jgi:hypothetical protein
VNFVAVKMLTGDRTKYVGLIFAGIMWRTTSQIQDVRDAEIWVMDPMRLPRTSRRMRWSPQTCWARPEFRDPLASRVEPIPCGAETVIIHISRQHSVVTMPPPSAT